MNGLSRPQKKEDILEARRKDIADKRREMEKAQEAADSDDSSDTVILAGQPNPPRQPTYAREEPRRSNIPNTMSEDSDGVERQLRKLQERQDRAERNINHMKEDLKWGKPNRENGTVWLYSHSVNQLTRPHSRQFKLMAHTKREDKKKEGKAI